MTTHNKNAKNLMLLFVLTLLTKGLGFLKTAITAAIYGMNVQTDIYNLADGIVNQVFYAFTVSVCLIIVPLYLEKNAQSDLAGKRFAKSAYLSIWGFGGVLLVLAAAFTPLLAKLVGREYTPAQVTLLTQYMWCLSTGLALSLVTNALQSILNARRVYGYPSLCAMLGSAIVIGFMLLFSKQLGIWAMVLAVPVSFLAQTVILHFRTAPFMRLSLRKESFDPDVKRLYTQMVPVFLSNASMELNGFFDKYILAGLAAGAVTAVSYANVLLVFATNIITIPVTTVLFTDVSDLCAQKKYDQVRTLTETTVVKSIALCLPIVGITALCSGDIVNCVFGYGAFDQNAVTLTAQALTVYGVSIVFYVLKDTVNRVCYALQETRTPLIAGIMGVLVHISLSLLLVERYGMIAVAWGTVAGVACMAGFTYLRLSKKYLRCNLRPYAISFLKIAAAFAATMAALILLNRLPMPLSSQLASFIRFGISAIIGFALYFGLLLMMKETQTRSILAALTKKQRGPGA